MVALMSTPLINFPTQDDLPVISPTMITKIWKLYVINIKWIYS